MKIERTHHVEASEEHTEGKYDWYYEYDIFRFVEAERALVARCYADTPSEAHFVSLEVQAMPMPILSEDAASPLLRRSAEYLRSIGKVRIQYLGPEGYVPLPDA